MISRTQIERFRGRIQTQAEEVTPATLVIGAQEFPCSTSGLQKNAQSVELGGFLGEADVTFRVRKELLGSTEIRIGMSVRWKERDLALKVEDAPTGSETSPVVVLKCKAANRKP